MQIYKVRLFSIVHAALRRVKFRVFQLSLSRYPEDPISIVTGADHSHFRSSLQLLGSIKEFEPQSHVIYFNLGLKGSELQELNRLFPFLTIVTFNFSKFPDWYNIQKEAGQYAWKPAAICIALKFTNHNLLWLDAGDMLVSQLGNVKKLISRDGIFIMQTSNSVGELTHPATIAYFNAEKSIQRLQLSAAIVGFSRNSQIAMGCLHKWHELSNIREVIAPRNSSRLNHRQDQAVLTLVLFAIKELDVKIRRFLFWELENRSLGLLTHQDVEDYL